MPWSLVAVAALFGVAAATAVLRAVRGVNGKPLRRR